MNTIEVTGKISCLIEITVEYCWKLLFCSF